MNVNVHRAEPIRGDKSVDPVSIHITRTMPDAPHGGQNGTGALMDADAHAIHDALRSSLPGGTYDRLFAVMAARVASQLHVPKH